jgi:hypothetical protein
MMIASVEGEGDGRVSARGQARSLSALQVIREARARLAPQYGPKAVAFQFAQVGRQRGVCCLLGSFIWLVKRGIAASALDSNRMQFA